MCAYHKQGYIEARSDMMCELESIKLGTYDLIIVAANWDSRCACITEIENLGASYGLILMYVTSDSQGRQEKHEKIIKKYLSEHCENTIEIRYDSQDIETLWKNIYKQIENIYLQEGHSLRICFDLSAFSRYCSLAILARCIPNGIAESITYFYAEGIYDKNKKNELGCEFHKGEWKAIPIDGFEGEYNVGLRHKNNYLISVGFEGAQTARVVAKDEPNRISILFPDPGVQEGYVEKAEQENKDLIEEYLVPEDQIIRAAASDAIEAWKKLDEAKLEMYVNSEDPIAQAVNNCNPNIFYLCCGTKPHALALGIRALTFKSPTVLYYVPDVHVETDVKPTGIYWTYNIKDLSALPRNGPGDK